MQIDKPLVSILLAVYKPNEKWLIEQLISLNEQSYNNLELIVYDDCPEYPVNEELFASNITNFSFKIIRGIENKGSNIALVCSDLSIIDENSKKTHESIRDIRKRIIYKSGYGLAKDLLISNFVTGCAMIVRKDIALKGMPFLDELVHDQWIAIIAALNGKIEFVDERLVRYRQHSDNQTGILKDVYDKESYYKKRIHDFYYRYVAYKKRLASFDELRNYIENSIKWIEARKNYSTRVSIKDLKIMIKYRDFHKVSILIEIVLPFIPNFIFKYIIKLAKKGML